MLLALPPHQGIKARRFCLFACTILRGGNTQHAPSGTSSAEPLGRTLSGGFCWPTLEPRSYMPVLSIRPQAVALALLSLIPLLSVSFCYLVRQHELAHHTSSTPAEVCIFKRPSPARRRLAAARATSEEPLCFKLRSTDIEGVVQLACQAGAAVMEVYNSRDKDWSIRFKEDATIVTRADKEANDIITKGLQQIAPSIPIVSEESPPVSNAIRQHYSYSWIVDPLDSTTNFILRSGQFTVNIALLHRSRPVMGVVYVPTQGKVYWAIKGRGAWVRDSTGQQRRLQCAEFSFDDPGLVVVGPHMHPQRQMQSVLRQLRQPKYRVAGSSLKMLMVAEGAAHVYPRLAPSYEWDTAAAQVIVEEAGGAVLEGHAGWNTSTAWLQDAVQRHVPLQYNKASQSNPHFLVLGRLSTRA